MFPHPTPAKRCSKCRAVKPASAFGVESRRPDGRRCFCKECGNRDSRAYRESSAYLRRKAEGVYHGWNRRCKLRSRYRIDEALYQRMFQNQGGCCAICSSAEPGGRWGRFAVDHDHATGKVRGLLCHPCNTALGLLGDTTGAVRKVLAYLER